MPDYNDMTLAQLAKKKTELSARREEILDEQKLIAAAIDVKVAEETARKKVEAMSPDEKKEIAQILGAEAIKSEESVGSPD